jgi:hypothetical protein
MSRKLHFHLPPFPSLQDALFVSLAGRFLFLALRALFEVAQTLPLKSAIAQRSEQEANYDGSKHQQ